MHFVSGCEWEKKVKVRSEENILSANIHTNAQHNPDPGSKSKKRGKKLVLSSTVKQQAEGKSERVALASCLTFFHVTLSMN